MKKSFIIAGLIAGFMPVFAQDKIDVDTKIDNVLGGTSGSEVKSFPTEAVTTELTDEQRKEAEKLRSEASKTYSEVMTYSSSSRAETVKKNIEFIDKAIVEAEAKRTVQVDEYKALSLRTLNEGKRIKEADISQEMKDKKLIDLQDKYDQLKDTMTYRIKNLTSRIEKLKKRKGVYEYEQKDLAIVIKDTGAQRPKTQAEKDAERKKEALTTLDEIEKDLTNKEYEKLLK